MLADTTIVEVKRNPTQVIIPDAAETGSMLLELGWEMVRCREFPERPSRWDCLFLWQQEVQARRFHRYRPWPTSLYEVKIIECNRVFVANMDLISSFDIQETVAKIWTRARTYWAHPFPDGEVLLEGFVEIVQVLQDGPAQRSEEK
jgi:hypothetical protein